MRVLALGLAGLLLAGCIPLSSDLDDRPNPNARPDRPYGVPQYSIAPERTLPRRYGEFHHTSQAPTARPSLPPLQEPVESGRYYEGVRPLTVSVGRYGEPGERIVASGRFRPNGMLPLRQLIHGGAYAEADAPGTYRLAVRDQIRLTVKEHPEFSGILQVNPDGTIKIPNTQDYVEVEGIEAEDVVILVKRKIRPYLKHEPAVEVTVHLGMGGHYFVFGEVPNQGRFPMGTKGIRLSEAIFRACSKRFTADETMTREEAIRADLQDKTREQFSMSANAKLQKVAVVTPHRSHPRKKYYDVRAALYEGKTSEDPFLKAGQIVILNTYDGVSAPEGTAGDSFFERLLAGVREEDRKGVVDDSFPGDL